MADITRTCLPIDLVVRHVQVVELRAAVVADEARHLLEVGGLELEPRRGAHVEGLLPAGHERLPEQAADGLAPEEPEVPGAGRQAEQVLRRTASAATGSRSAAAGRRTPRVPAAPGTGEAAAPAPATSIAGSPCPSRVRSHPSGDHVIGWMAVSRPRVQRPRFAQRAAAQVDHLGLAVRRLDQVGVPRALQRGIGAMARGEHLRVRVQLVRPRSVPRARHRHGVPPEGAALGRQQVVVAVALVEVRRLGEAERRAREDVPSRSRPGGARRPSIPASRCRRSGSARAASPTAC